MTLGDLSKDLIRTLTVSLNYSNCNNFRVSPISFYLLTIAYFMTILVSVITYVKREKGESQESPYAIFQTSNPFDIVMMFIALLCNLPFSYVRIKVKIQEIQSL